MAGLALTAIAVPLQRSGCHTPELGLSNTCAS